MSSSTDAVIGVDDDDHYYHSFGNMFCEFCSTNDMNDDFSRL